jgi:hypothetical protein
MIKNIGIITITQEAAKCFELMQLIQRDVVVHRTEENYMTNQVYFYCSSYAFDEVESAVIVPHYDVVVDDSDNGNQKVSFVRRQ